MGACKSLEGGRLVSSAMQHHSLVDQAIIGFAMGPLQLADPTGSKVNATVHDGLILERDVMISYVAGGSQILQEYPAHSHRLRAESLYVTLVIDDSHDGFCMANAIAQAIQHDLGDAAGDTQMAIPMDMKNVVIRVPDAYADDPVPLLYEIEKLTFLLPEKGARVVIDRAKDLIAIDGEVQVSPVIFSVKGLTINVFRGPDGQAQTPTTDERRFVGVDPGDLGGPALSRLLEQLNQIKVRLKLR